MGLLADRKALIRCIEQLEEKVVVVVVVDQHYRSSESGKAGMFWLQQVVSFFLFSMTSWLTSDHVINKKHIEGFIGNM